MITYNKYVNNEDHTWYDSSNVVYSVCYDNNESFKNVKIVFQKGRTYLYRDVNVNDYLMFKNAVSHGQSVNKYIVKKYQGIRLPDMEIDKLEELKNDFTEDDRVTEDAFEKLTYHIDYNNETGEFVLKMSDKPIYTGIEGQVSIVNLFRCMNVKYSMTEMIHEEKEETEKKEDINDGNEENELQE